MAHKLYENFVLENKIESILETKLDINSYITTDNSLQSSAGMKKEINTYVGEGKVQELAMGEGNSIENGVTFTTEEYTVGTTQGRFVYYDEQAMTDPKVIETGLKAQAEGMVNDLVGKAFTEFRKGTKCIDCTSGVLTFDDVVDAITEMDLEGEETGLFILINPAQKGKIRKELADSLKFVEDYVRKGYIGHICGVPVIVTKAVEDGEAFLATKEAVTVFVKKGAEIEQERDANTRKNTVYIRKVALVALTDATKVVKFAFASEE